MPEDELIVYSLKDVARLLKVSRQTVYNYLKSGKLKATKIGKEYRVKEKDLKELIDKGHN